MPALRIKKADLDWEPHKSIQRILRRWEPTHPKDARRNPATEGDWKESLFRYMTDCLPDVQVTKERGAGMWRGDILLRYKRWPGTSTHVVELKKGLKSSSEFMRLQQQIRNYVKEMDWVYVVICGDDVEQRFLRQLKDEQSSWLNSKLGIYRKAIEGPLTVVLEP